MIASWTQVGIAGAVFLYPEQLLPVACSAGPLGVLWGPVGGGGEGGGRGRGQGQEYFLPCTRRLPAVQLGSWANPTS